MKKEISRPKKDLILNSICAAIEDNEAQKEKLKFLLNIVLNLKSSDEIEEKSVSSTEDFKVKANVKSKKRR